MQLKIRSNRCPHCDKDAMSFAKKAFILPRRVYPCQWCNGIVGLNILQVVASIIVLVTLGRALGIKEHHWLIIPMLSCGLLTKTFVFPLIKRNVR